MPQPDHDDLADALSQLSAGEIAPSESEPPAPMELDAPSEGSPAHLIQPALSRQPEPVAARPAAPGRPQNPMPHVAPLPGANADGVVSSTPPASAARVTIRAATPVTRRPRPMAPTLNTAGPVVTGDESSAAAGDEEISPSESEPQIVEGDDIVIMPTPDVSVLAQPARRAGVARPMRPSRKHLEFRRTMIPILLTCCVVMFAFAALKFLSGGDSSLTLLPLWVPVLLIVAGLILFALAVVNMLAVKAQMETKG